MRILVAGGAGYIGSHCVRLLARAGHEVYAFDNLVCGHAAAVPTGALVVGDLHDGASLRRTLRERRIEAVMHFAASALVGESVVDPGKYYHNNVVGSLSLLEAMRAADVRKIVFSSTTATYGVPKSVPITEREVQQPINPYGYTKLVIERALADYARAYGFGSAALRYFNAAGAATEGDIGEDHTPESHLIPMVLQTALGRREKIVIYGDDYPTADGTCVRDYVHVDDLSDAHLRALESLQPGATLELNLGLGRGYSVREVIDACRRVTGRKIVEVAGARREGDPPQLVADASAARRILGWSPRYTSLDEIVATACRKESAVTIPGGRGACDRALVCAGERRDALHPRGSPGENGHARAFPVACVTSSWRANCSKTCRPTARCRPAGKRVPTIIGRMALEYFTSAI
jgi:UDP-glucose 4-epimerase